MYGGINHYTEYLVFPSYMRCGQRFWVSYAHDVSRKRGGDYGVRWDKHGNSGEWYQRRQPHEDMLFVLVDPKHCGEWYVVVGSSPRGNGHPGWNVRWDIWGTWPILWRRPQPCDPGNLPYSPHRLGASGTRGYLRPHRTVKAKPILSWVGFRHRTKLAF